MWSGRDDLLVALDAIESAGFDSVWLSDHVTSATPEPLTTLAFAAAATRRLKLGLSVLVLPGRRPLVTAKALATLDRLSDGRLLPVFGSGVAEEAEHQAFGVERGRRGRLLEEGVVALRKALACTTHVGTAPARRLDLWLGGRDDREIRRAARVADGWLGHFLTPAQAGAAVSLLHAEATRHDRTVPADHIGMYLLYGRDRLPDGLERIVGDRGTTTELVPCGRHALSDALTAYAAQGVDKFVLVPASPPDDWRDEMTWLRSAVGDLAGAEPAR